MKTYKYTDSTNTVVHVIDEDGKSRCSMLVTTLEPGTTILPADTPSQSDQLSSIRETAKQLIFSVYPDWFQLNCANGIYPQIVIDKMKTDIAGIITESNRCEDLIIAGQLAVPNWPVIGG